MSKEIKIIAVDVMGGDFSPKEQIYGIIEALKEYDDIRILAVGNKDNINDILRVENVDLSRVEIIHTEEVIEMTDSPVISIKRKKDSSMVKAIQLVKEKKACACISSGNTGALLAASQGYLKRLNGVKRPPLAPIIPTRKGPAILVDCGANIDSRPEHLVNYAILGSIFIGNLYGIKNPRVAIVNVGVEEEKGNKLVKETYPLLKELKCINFVGSVEAKEIFSGEFDVIVCDAFVGNVILKLTEGILTIGKDLLKEVIYTSMKTKMAGMIIKDTVKKKFANFDVSQYGGAMLIGLDGLVVKCHGSAKRNEIKNAIGQAYDFVDKQIVSKISEKMEEVWN